MERRASASERTREALHGLIEGRLSSEFRRTELVKLATHLIIDGVHNAKRLHAALG